MTPLLPWQQHDWQRLNQYRNQQRIPQALLMTGRKGLGKQLLARQFAASLLCLRTDATGLACGSCKPCQLFQADSHPDFYALSPEEPSKTISIDQIRNLISVLTLKPQYPQHRVIIIYPAEHMNLRAQNAFLKCLEEPAERSVILLLSERPAKLPATIASRCQQFALTTPDSTCGLAWLATQTAQQDLALPYRLAQGAPLAALAYCSGLTLALRQDCFKAWLEVANRQKSPVQIAEHWQKLPETQLLAWLISWVSDLIKCCFLSDADQLHNPDLQQPLQVLAQRLELSYLFKFYDVLINRYTLLDTTINKQLLLEELLIHWQTLNPTNNHVRPHS